MERYYLADIRTFPDPAADPASLAGLPQARREKCLRYLRPDDRKRCLAAGRIAARILRDAGCAAPLTTGPNGKPEAPGVYFNLSHGGRYVLGVLAQAPVGCDVEEMGPAPLKTADRFFYRGEKDYLAQSGDPDFAFWQLWTLKESYMKMTGEGFQLPLDGFQVVPGTPIRLYRGGVLQDCALHHLVYEGHSMAFCLEGATGPLGPVVWDLLDGRNLRP